MKAIRVEKQGGPEVLKLLDVAPIEAPGPGQAVVRVVAAGVNFVDVGQRRGTYPRQVPFTLGVEGAGVEWPGSDLAILVIAAFVGLVSVVLTQALRRQRHLRPVEAHA